MIRILLNSAFLATALLALPAAPAVAAAWFHAGGGFARMAMGDVNGAVFDFYEDPSATARFGDVGAGFVLDLGIGHDVEESWGLGFHWHRQWASTKATDQGVDGELDLGADFMLARFVWRPLRLDGWTVGLTAGTGPVFSRGSARVRRGNVNYGERDAGGGGWSVDGGFQLEVGLPGRAELQIQGGWRDASIGKLKLDGYEVTKADGSLVELDYSGWQVMAGVRWLFSEGGIDAR